MREILMELMKDGVEAIRAETREETRKETISAVAKRMLSQHLGLSQIVRATELPEGEVRSLGLAIVS